MKLKYKLNADVVSVARDGGGRPFVAERSNNMTIEVSDEQGRRILEQNGQMWEEVKEEK